MKLQTIDINYYVYEDSNNGDPDTKSKKLNHYHYLLWNKKLPNKTLFKLEKIGRKTFYLKYESNGKQMILSSDSIVHPYHYWKSMKKIIDSFDRCEIEKFHRTGATIGGYIIFPSRRVNNKLTINAARGLNKLIKDRFDFTLECIRRWYLRIDSPLFSDLERYKDFFLLFDNFKGYVDFFILQDLVDIDYNVKFFLPFEEFGKTQPLPQTSIEYEEYMKNVLLFVQSRNNRIKEWVEKNIVY